MADDVVIRFRSDTGNVDAQLKQLRDELNKVGSTGAGKGLNSTSNAAQGLGNALNKTTNSAGLLGKALGGLATGGGIAAFGALQGALGSIPSAVAKNTLQFEKFNTVLTTLFGDAGKAKEAFAGIQQFASTTPFELSEVTDSFIKLKNRGIDPTKETLTSLGDLAASQGKSLNQVTEALLDSVGGENERLKEFGISAKTVGDQVTFTFKGVTQTVDKTPEAIQAAIVKFGELKGVAGGMEAQSKTLGGQLSNLSDAAAKISVAFGNELIPVLQEFVGALNSGGGSAEQFAKELGQGTADNLRLLGQALKFVSDNAAPLKLALEVLLLRFAALRAIALIQTLQATAARLIATGAAGGVAAGGIGAVATAAAIAAGPLIVLTAAVAATQFIKLGQDLRIANEELDALGNGANASGDAAILLANKTKNLNTEIGKTGKATDAQKAKAQQLIALNKEQVKSLEDQLAQVKAVKPANEEQANSQKALEANLQSSINALKGQTTALEENIAGKKASAKATKDNSKEEAEALKLKRDAEKTGKQEDFQDSQQQKEQSFQDAKQQREQSFQDQKQAAEQAFQDQQKAAEQAFADEQAVREQAFQDNKQTREAVFADQQRQKEQAFQDQQKAAQEAFQEGQRIKQNAFNAEERRLDELFAKDQADQKAAFDEGLSAEEQTIKRRQQLRGADPDQRAELRKSFREQDRNAKELEPLEAKRKAFEEKQRAEKEREERLKQEQKQAFEAKQKEEQQAFEAAQKEQARLFQEEQRAIEVAFKAEEQAKERVFKAEQQAADRTFKAEQQEKDKTFKLEQQAADRAFKAEEQAAEREFKAEQREADRAFKQQQREFDLETARQVKAIAESTKPPEATPTTPTKPTTPAPTKVPGRRLGGSVDSGGLYQVGEAGSEYFVPSQNGFVLRHEEAIALAREALGTRAAIPTVNLAPSGNDAMLAEMRATRRVMEKIESRELQANFPVNFEGPKVEENYDRYYRWGRSLMRGMI